MDSDKRLKVEFAFEYLEVAADFWLKDINLASALHLAGAAEELLGQYCRNKGFDSRRDEWVKFGNKFKDGPFATGLSGTQFANEVYRLKNSVKHMNSDLSDQLIDINLKKESARYIRQAYDNALKLDLANHLSKEIHQVIDETNIYLEVGE